MNVHPKTVRRVMILIVGAGLLTAALAAVVIVRQRQIAARYMASRAEGIAAVERGDYAAALDSLKGYVTKYKKDVGALVAYATARSRLEDPTGKHLAEGMHAFRVVLAMDPENVTAQRALLELFPRAGYHREAIELANALLERNPDDVDALRAKAVALERSRRYDEAVIAYERLNEVAPDDLQSQLKTYELYRRTERPAEQVMARAKAMAEKHPGDARYEMLLGIAQCDSDEVSRGRELLRTAAARPDPSAELVAALVTTFDRYRMFADAQTLLERAVTDNPDPRIMRVLVQRLWQGGRADLVAKRLRNVQPQDPDSDSQLLALRALSLYETDSAADAEPIARALAARENDPSATAWATALAVRFALEPVEHKAAVAKYGAALSADPGNAIIRCWLGDAYERVGETEPAIAAWRQAAEMAPSWAVPHARIARAYAATGRPRQALLHASAARYIAPTQLYPLVSYAVAASADLGRSNDPEKVSELLRFVDRIQTAQPGEPETLPMYVALLARAGERARAVDVIDDALKAQPPHDTETLIRLAATSRAEKLGREAPLFEAVARQQPTPSPRIALAQAGELANAGKPLDGLAMLQEAARSAGGDAAQALEWKLALTQYREHIKDPAAAAEWVALGDANPDSVQVQAAILKLGASASADRALIERTIERLKNLTGEEGTLWKMERARWLLGSDRERDHSDAVNTLSEIVRSAPSLVEPRLLLAAAFDKVGNVSGAIKELTAAAELQPKSAPIAMELARLLQGQGKFAEARAALDRAGAAFAELDPESRRRVALMYAQGGDVARATELLSGASKSQSLDADGELLLAELYRRQGRTADAQAVYSRLLEQPTLDARTIYAAADFHASRGDRAAADAALARLDTAQLRPGERELVRAAFAQRHEGRDAAAAQYASATGAAPTDPATWRERIEFLLRIGRASDAVAAADDAVKALPNNDRLHALKLHAQNVAAASHGSGDLQPLIESLAADGGAPEAVELLSVLKQAQEKKLNPEQTTAQLRQLGDRLVRYKPLQLELIRRYIALGKLLEAADVAGRAIASFPSDPEPAALAAGVHRKAGQWKQMESAARTWRARSLENPMAADTAIAEALLGQNNPSGALTQLRPYLAAASTEPQRHTTTAAIAARALAASGREDEARAMLQPSLLVNSPAWRMASMSIAANDAARADHAAAWLDTIAALVPDTATDERLALASAWHALGSRTDLPRAFEAARSIITPMTRGKAATPEVLLISAAVSESSGDAAAAEDAYRKTLEMAPDNAGAMNNLAYLLLSSNRKLDEARKLAERAVALQPQAASFHDTLARIQLKTGDREAALKSFERALAADPSSLEALIGKASVLAAAGAREEVRRLLSQVDALLQGGARISPVLQQELAMARNGSRAAVDPR